MFELDPFAQRLLDATMTSGLPPVYEISVGEARDRMRAGFVVPHAKRTPCDIVEEGTLSMRDGAQISIRRFLDSPADLLVVYIHGGGWVVNDLDTHDEVCRRIVRSADCEVISVHLRTSPEFKYPVPIHDACDALDRVMEEEALGGHRRVVVMGDSSGGSSAIVATQDRLRRGVAVPQGVVALYPQALPPGRTASYVERGAGYSLNRPMMEWFWLNFASDGEADDEFGLLDLDYTGFPPTIITVAEFDPLRDEGVMLANSIKARDNQVIVRHVDDQMHGYIMQFRAIPRANDELSYLGWQLRNVSKGRGWRD